LIGKKKKHGNNIKMRLVGSKVDVLKNSNHFTESLSHYVEIKNRPNSYDLRVTDRKRKLTLRIPLVIFFRAQQSLYDHHNIIMSTLRFRYNLTIQNTTCFDGCLLCVVLKRVKKKIQIGGYIPMRRTIEHDSKDQIIQVSTVLRRTRERAAI